MKNERLNKQKIEMLKDLGDIAWVFTSGIGLGYLYQSFILDPGKLYTNSLKTFNNFFDLQGTETPFQITVGTALVLLTLANNVLLLKLMNRGGIKK